MGYYSEKLSGKRLQKCYEIAPPRVKQYLEAEIQFLLKRIKPEDTVLELGCGYGRVVIKLADAARQIIGIDTSLESLKLAREIARMKSNCEFVRMDAINLGFKERIFDLVACIQNGICAFGVDQSQLLQEALRVTRLGGLVLFSTYSHRFWSHRLKWFELQSAHGLLGAIDYEATGNGTIVCKDGFRAGAMTDEDFKNLCSRLGVESSLYEIDGSSLFCEILIK